MRPYGIRRNEHGDTDCAGIRSYGRKSSIGRFKGPSGETRAMQKPSGKDKARRYLKRRARAEGKKSAKEDV